jgi:hypothetical protein
VRVDGAPAASIYGFSIDRVGTAQKGPIVRVLGRPGVSSATGKLTLGEVERRDLVDGKLALVVYTAGEPRGTIKAAMVLPAADRPR